MRRSWRSVRCACCSSVVCRALRSSLRQAGRPVLFAQYGSHLKVPRVVPHECPIPERRPSLGRVRADGVVARREKRAAAADHLESDDSCVGNLWVRDRDAHVDLRGGLSHDALAGGVFGWEGVAAVASVRGRVREKAATTRGKRYSWL